MDSTTICTVDDDKRSRTDIQCEPFAPLVRKNVAKLVTSLAICVWKITCKVGKTVNSGSARKQN